MDRMCILHLRKSEGFYGAERVILSLAKAAKRHGIKSVVGCINDTRRPCTDLASEAERNQVENILFACEKRLDLILVRDIVRFVRQRKVDLIHTHGFKANLYGLLASMMTGIPVLSTMHGWTHANVLIRMWERIDLFILRFFPKIVAVSQALLQDLAKNGIDTKRIIHISNALAVPGPCGDSHLALRSELGILPEEKVVGIVGRLSVEKGHRYFFDAAKKVFQTFPHVKFLVVGEGNLRPSLEVYAHNLGLEDRILFTGFQKEVYDYYRLMDVVVSSSLQEGVPINLLEASAHGKPVVASSVGGIPSIVEDGRTGYLVPPGDAEAIALRIEQILSDGKLAEKMGDRGKAVVKSRFNLENMVRSYVNEYLSMTGKKNTEEKSIKVMTKEDVSMKTLYMVWAPHNRHSESFARHFGTEIVWINYFKYMNLKYAPIKYPLMVVKTIYELMKRKPDLVFAMTPPLFCVFFVYLYTLFTKSRFVIDSHTGSLLSPPWVYLRSLHRFLCRKTIATIVTNEYLANLVRSWDARAIIITPPIEFPNVDAYPLESSQNLLVVSTFSCDEPLEEIINAARLTPNANFYISGNVSKASNSMTRTKPPNVHFTGFLPYEKYVALLKSVDGVISITTRDHTLQSGGEEALFLGKPLITTRFPYLMQFFSKGTVYVEPRAESIASGVCQLLRDREKLGDEMVRLRDEHIRTWKACHRQLIHLIEQPN